MDSYKLCRDRNHYKQYPYTVEYSYNSRGFRDDEWPTTIEELKECVWCFGDSFTVGIGSPLNHTWANILQTNINSRCINISMDGASNDWIARKAARVLEIINPKQLIIHWSFLHRRERALSATYQTDESRVLSNSESINALFDIDADFTNFNKNVSLVNNHNVIHSFIPDDYSIFCPLIILQEKWNFFKGADWPNLFPNSTVELEQLDKQIKQELQNDNLYDHYYNYLYHRDKVSTLLTNNLAIPMPRQLDFARDGFHYDKLTATQLVNSILQLNRFS
jgi:hypothetical protein